MAHIAETVASMIGSKLCWLSHIRSAPLLTVIKNVMGITQLTFVPFAAGCSICSESTIYGGR